MLLGWLSFMFDKDFFRKIIRISATACFVVSVVTLGLRSLGTRLFFSVSHSRNCKSFALSGAAGSTANRLLPEL